MLLSYNRHMHDVLWAPCVTTYPHGALFRCDEHGALLRPPSLQVGGSTVSKAIVAASGVNEARLRCVRRVHCAYPAQPLLRVDECLKWC